MITRLKHCIACREVASGPDGLSYVGVLDHGVRAETRPGAAEVTFALRIETDGRRGSGRVRVTGDHYDEAFPFVTAADTFEVGIVLALTLPVLRAGSVSVQVLDDRAGAPDLVERFQLGYTPAAPPAPGLSKEALRARTKAAAEAVRRSARGGLFAAAAA